MGIPLCRGNSCPICEDSAEAAVVDAACFKLFVSRCKHKEALRRLWIAISWSIPWRGAPDLRLERVPRTASILSQAVAIPELARLAHVPLEIVFLIQDYSASSILWAYSSTVDLANQMSEALPQEELVSYPLQEVLAWERGGSPLLTARPQRSTTRLTIDARGIKAIERFATSPPYCYRPADNLVFVVVKDDRLADALMHFKVRYPLIPLSTFFCLTVPSMASVVCSCRTTPRASRSGTHRRLRTPIAASSSQHRSQVPPGFVP